MSAAIQRVQAFAPASVSNVACGFDTLGFAVRTLGDHVTATRTHTPGVVVTAIRGDGGRLPLETERNTAGTAAAAVLELARDPEAGVEIEIDKGMPLSSGLGSSAASAVAATVATQRLLGLDLTLPQTLECALAGEAIASGARHADNVAPSLLGDLLLVRSLEPEPDIVVLPAPLDLHCVVVRPHVSINTAESRRLLGDHIALRSAVTQWSNLGAFVAALYQEDADLLGRSLVDVVAEPCRKAQVPCFDAVQSAAREAGALGCSLSGSGPAIFALTVGRSRADEVAAAMDTALDPGIDRDLLVSAMPAPGAHVVEES